MGHHVHWDGSAGAAGDMLFASLIDAGANIDNIRETLKKLPLGDWKLSSKKTLASGISSTQIDVEDLAEEEGHSHSHGHSHDDEHPHEHDHSDSHEHSHDAEHSHGHAHTHSHDHSNGARHLHTHSHDKHKKRSHRHLSDLLELTCHAAIPARAGKRAAKIFQALAEAEAKVHGTSPDKVHFHEISGIDTAIDVIGTCLALEYLNAETITASVPYAGTGTIKCAHGILPVPPPAVAEILRTYNRSYIAEGEGERLTPTGAAILAVLTDSFSTMPTGFAIESIGYGAGHRPAKDRPNVVRVQVGKITSESRENIGALQDEVMVITCSIDDMAGESCGYLAERLFAAGALEVYWTPIVMKKSRPAVELTVLVSHSDSGKEAEVQKMLWLESSIFGFRKRVESRSILERYFLEKQVAGQPIRIKIGKLNGKIIRCQPEYEDCKKAALASGLPLSEIFRLASEE